jgi:hypothetical protein
MPTDLARNLTYDASSHTYKIGARRVPGITSLLSAMGYYAGSQYYPKSASHRGSAVHLAVFLVDEHCPEAETTEEALAVLSKVVDIGEAIVPYLDGYMLWKREHGFKPERHEFQVCSTRLNIAATLDLYGRLASVPTVVEIKTWKETPPKPQRSAELQTAGQQLMIREYLKLPVERRIVVALTGETRMPYRAYECSNPTDESMVAAMSAVFWDRTNSGLLKWDQPLPEVEE